MDKEFVAGTGWEVYKDIPQIKGILEETRGVIIYQEQILEICKLLGGYSLGEADMIRRIVGKKKEEEMKPALEKLLERFVSYGKLERVVAERLIDNISKFASYCFNKSHATAYAEMSWITAWIKANYPLEFWCEKINKNDKYIAMARQEGIVVLPPSHRLSASSAKVDKGVVLLGYRQVKGFGKREVTACEKMGEWLVVNQIDADVAKELVAMGTLNEEVVNKFYNKLGYKRWVECCEKIKLGKRLELWQANKFKCVWQEEEEQKDYGVESLGGIYVDSRVNWSSCSLGRIETIKSRKSKKGGTFWAVDFDTRKGIICFKEPRFKVGDIIIFTHNGDVLKWWELWEKGE
jgi:polyhydroxyalkanoate synthesis regulator phasin